MVVSKICPYDGGVCRDESCDSVNDMGIVILCSRHGNCNGRFLSHSKKSDFSGFSFVVSPKRKREVVF